MVARQRKIKGRFLVGRHLTNKQDESSSFLGAFADDAGTDMRNVDATLGGSDDVVYIG